MYKGGLIFTINKSFGILQLVPNAEGLRLCFTPIENDRASKDMPGYLDLILPLDAIGGLWATARAFLYAVESLDENIIIQSGSKHNNSDALIKLYRDKPNGPNGTLGGTENCWLRLVTGRSESERRRIKLGPRDLLSLELACNSVLVLSGANNTHLPKLINK